MTRPILRSARESLASLRQQLADHLKLRPLMPRPYDPHSEDGIAYHRSFSAWADRKQLLTHRIAVAEHPIDLATRQDRPLHALPARPPVRLRK